MAINFAFSWISLISAVILASSFVRSWLLSRINLLYFSIFWSFSDCSSPFAPKRKASTLRTWAVVSLWEISRSYFPTFASLIPTLKKLWSICQLSPFPVNLDKSVWPKIVAKVLRIAANFWYFSINWLILLALSIRLASRFSVSIRAPKVR
ncbi:hypothetical protein R7Y11_03450 [Mesomycoplasma ovipneumoniae]|uniref:hypothetical protein n=1 Tax=Mesomycoplasma ovipneumoniae TaxID=29562 RepID=UPI002964AC7C|nr:hypothetical protein [Mesomycoplasma ovipneumoniae]MDW2925228.1 hypothetical protein [Mesomycoplasma ovipneumoniae]